MPVNPDVAGVQGYLPQVTLDSSSQPSDVEVEEFLASISSIVRVAIGTIPDGFTDAQEGHIEQAVEGLVELGVAAMAEDAAWARAGRSGANDRGELLWQRFRSLMDMLTAAVEKMRVDLIDGVIDGTTQQPPASGFFPQPYITGNLRW